MGPGARALMTILAREPQAASPCGADLANAFREKSMT
jgi:hypothetical protein